MFGPASLNCEVGLNSNRPTRIPLVLGLHAARVDFNDALRKLALTLLIKMEILD
jgi:hypothetical protein